MKIYIFLVTVFLSLMSLCAKAQDSKNNRFLTGGTLGFNYSAEKSSGSDIKTTYLSATPLAGYSITKTVMAGLALEANVENVDFGGQLKKNDYLISPFLRYYVISQLFIQGQFNMGYSRSEETSGGDIDSFISKHSVRGIGVGLGYDIRLSDAIQLEPMVRYISNRYKGKMYGSYDYKSTVYWFNLGLIYRL